MNWLRFAVWKYMSMTNDFYIIYWCSGVLFMKNIPQAVKPSPKIHYKGHCQVVISLQTFNISLLQLLFVQTKARKFLKIILKSTG